MWRPRILLKKKGTPIPYVRGVDLAKAAEHDESLLSGLRQIVLTTRRMEAIGCLFRPAMASSHNNFGANHDGPRASARVPMTDMWRQKLSSS